MLKTLPKKKAVRRPTEQARLASAVHLVDMEIKRATSKNPAFNSCHEGYAVILEELDELKEEVWLKKSRRNPKRMKAEAVQVAAMAIRFIVDLL